MVYCNKNHVCVHLSNCILVCLYAFIETVQQSDGDTQLGRLDDGAAAAGFICKCRFSRRGMGSKWGLDSTVVGTRIRHRSCHHAWSCQQAARSIVAFLRARLGAAAMHKLLWTASMFLALYDSSILVLSRVYI